MSKSLLAPAALILAVILSACGGSPPADNSTAAPAAEPAPATDTMAPAEPAAPTTDTMAPAADPAAPAAPSS